MCDKIVWPYFNVCQNMQQYFLLMCLIFCAIFNYFYLLVLLQLMLKFKNCIAVNFLNNFTNRYILHLYYSSKKVLVYTLLTISLRKAKLCSVR